KILLIDSSEREVKTVVIEATPVMDLLRSKLKLSILDANLDLYEHAAENIYKIETKYVDNGVGDVNVFNFDYAFPKQDRSALEVVTTVKMKYENGKVTPYILSVKQKQY
ncbi:MAG: hypothetical protein K2Q18_09070, partial [Bdellovibrionales bacterium]|nr:hypothetical protein [Bdellovibrionales bacterium]